MTRSTNRQIARSKGRRALQLANHIEKLGSAFCREVGLPPSEVSLMSEMVPPKNGESVQHRYWYEKKSAEHVIVESLPPDVRLLISKVQLLTHAYNAKEGETVKDGFRDIEALMASWE